MAKITEKLLLERGTPKSTKLEQIHSLNLSRLCLHLEDLPVPLLSRLVSLEHLDLSKNRLKEFPRSLLLPALKHLDLSDNQLEDVTSLEALSTVEELNLEDNLYITVSDNYKLMVLLPLLRMHNGKDITATANHLRYVCTDNLRSRIISLWERSFRLPQPLSKDKVATLEKEFVNTVKRQVKFGPSSVSDFTKWKVGIMASEFFKSLTKEKDQPEQKSSSEKSQSPLDTTPKKRRRELSPVETKSTPVKRTPVPAPPVCESPRKTSLKLLSLKEKQASRTSTRCTPQKENERTDSPRRPSTPPREPKSTRGTRQSKPEQVSLEPSSSPAKDLQLNTKPIFNQKPVSLRIHHVLQCHSKRDSPDDLSTQLWACAFQSDSAGSSRLVATCGGDSLCLIDCEVGVVMKKYKVPGEEFFALAWTTVLMSCGKSSPSQPCSVLAAGGKRGLVKLIHPRNNTAYGEFRASKKALSVLRFNPNKGNFLYTGSYDNKIVLWDIGGLDKQYNYKVVQLMSLECSSTPLHICIPPKAPLSHLLAACDDGLHCFSDAQTSVTSTRWRQMEVTFPAYKEEDSERDYHTVDGLAFLSDDIVASKNYLFGRIYLWSWSRTLAQLNQKSSVVNAVILKELQWTDTQVPYLALCACPERSYVMCGDDKGQVWTYHIQDLKDKSLAPKILSWPEPHWNQHAALDGPSINSVSVDPKLRYLVALTDKNLVLVWKEQETSCGPNCPQ